jgi:hypothetical protein
MKSSYILRAPQKYDKIWQNLQFFFELTKYRKIKFWLSQSIWTLWVFSELTLPSNPENASLWMLAILLFSMYKVVNIGNPVKKFFPKCSSRLWLIDKWSRLSNPKNQKKAILLSVSKLVGHWLWFSKFYLLKINECFDSLTHT